MSNQNKVGKACFTGHRPNKLGDPDNSMNPYKYESNTAKRAIEGLAAAVAKAYKKGVRHFIVGGALGIDQMAAEVCLTARDELCNDIIVELAVPFEGFNKVWFDGFGIRTHESHLRRCDIVTIVTEGGDHREICSYKSIRC